MEETTHKHITENPDSLEFGTPAKGGAVKVYGNFADEDTFKKKIDAAIKVRNYAQADIGIKPMNT